jgi:glucosamine-6-phosphate deaminase
MQTFIFPSVREMAQAAAAKATQCLKDAIAQQGSAAVVAATGASQFAFPDALASDPEIDWSRTPMLHYATERPFCSPTTWPLVPTTCSI